MKIATDESAFTRGQARTFAQFAACLALARGDRLEALAAFEGRHPTSMHLERVKAAVAAGTTSDSTWAGPLVALGQIGEAFISLIRPRTVLGKLEGVHPIPFNTKVARSTTGTTVGWVGEGRPIPATAMGFDALTQLPPTKIAGLSIITKELAQQSSPSASEVIGRDLSDAIIAFSDAAFLDPSKAAVAGVSPASITYGAPSAASSGTTAASIATDLRTLFGLVGTNLENPALVMRPNTAAFIASTLGAAGSPVSLGPKGGTLFGTDVITSSGVPTDANSPPRAPIILIDGNEILLADEGIELDGSENALAQLDSSPDYPTSGATNLVSLWQLDLLGLVAKRTVNWTKRHSNGVAYITGYPT